MYEHSRRTSRTARRSRTRQEISSLSFLVRSPVFENVMYHEFNLEKVQKRLLILHATQHPDAVPYVTLYSGDSSTSQPYFSCRLSTLSIHISQCSIY